MPRLLNLVLAALLLLLTVPARRAAAQKTGEPSLRPARRLPLPEARRAAAQPTGEPSREPILRIETGMHTAVIKRIGVDAANRYLVTASHDKTVRVWELPTGRLLRVIRVPLGAGNEGKLFAVALSPDGTTIAAGGWTSPDGLNTNIYLFDRESGRLLRRLGGLPNVVSHLVYSPDGRYLAATLGGKNGVRVYQTRDYSPKFRPK